MFEPNIDGLYTWIGVAAVSVTVLGTAAALPTAPPPDAEGLATTVDAVAGGEYPATAEHGVAADRIRVTDSAVTLAGSGGTRRAAFHFDGVTPVREDRRLERVLDGEHPERVFDSPSAFADATEAAKTAEPSWRSAPDRVRVRQVHWGDIRVTLVG